MEYRTLGRSGLKVSALSLGTATFGGKTEYFKAWGNTQLKEASRMIDVCVDYGVNLFDTANSYSDGESEKILGEALQGKRQKILIASKVGLPMGRGPNDFGGSRKHILKECEESLKRLKTNYIDLYYIHSFDETTPMEETLGVLDELIQSGKVRYVGCSSFSGWQLMKSLSISDQNHWSRYSAHQIYYSLVGRDAELDLIPLAQDQEIGNVVWSPLAGALLTGKISRNKKPPASSRLSGEEFIPYEAEKLYQIVDLLEELSEETGKSIAQIALSWVTHRPSISSVTIGVRSEEQLLENLKSIEFRLTQDQCDRLNQVSQPSLTYPHWQQEWFPFMKKEGNKKRI